MASYQPIVLPAPEQYGFMPNFAKSFSKSSNDYAVAVMKDRQRQERMDEANKYAQAAGLQMDGFTIDNEGNVKRSYKRPETVDDTFAKDPVKAIKQAMFSDSAAESLGKTMGVAPQTALDPQSDVMQKYFPTLAMTGNRPGMGIDESGKPLLLYADNVRKAVTDKYLPGYSQDQVRADMIGLPKKETQKSLPAEFTQDINDLKAMAGDDGEFFLNSLQKLAGKYADNPEALDRINKIATILKKTSVDY